MYPVRSLSLLPEEDEENPYEQEVIRELAASSSSSSCSSSSSSSSCSALDPASSQEQEQEEEEPWIHFSVLTPLKDIQIEARDWLLFREKTAYDQVLHGGFFCDPPGMGKTLSLIAAVQKNPGPTYNIMANAPCITLVVCPPQVIKVWADQLAQHTDLPRDAIIVYHGPGRQNIPFTDKTLFVITSYYILRNEFDSDMNEFALDHEPDEFQDEPGFKDGSIFNHNFYRIILDESHLAKNHKGKLGIAISYLRSCIKWVVTATPRINCLDDEFAYYRFLRLFRDWKSWRTLVPNSKSNFSEKKLERLAHCKEVMQQIQSEICLVRDKSLLNLPPKTEEYLTLHFSPEEQTFYDSLQIYALSRVERLEQAIQDKQFEECARAMGRNVLGLIYRLKLATTNCMFVLDCMPRLKGIRTLGEATEVLDFFNKSVNRKEECAVCLDQDADHISVCGHKLCKSCWDKTLAKQKQCPFCRHPVTSVKSVAAASASVAAAEQAKKEAEARGGNVKIEGPKEIVNFGLQEKSTKLNKLLELLAHHIGEKKENVVIVSQSILTLNYVQKHVDEAYPASAVRIDGSCSLEARNASIDAFQKDPNTKIMYYSLTCNPEGITLTRGTVLIHIDQWWNKTGKVSQVNDRIHRISQMKPTKIYYLCMDRTIETNIFKLQVRKENIINYRFEGQEKQPHLLNHDFDEEDDDGDNPLSDTEDEIFA